MKQYGLIGFPLTHSFSKKYFEEKFIREKITNASYELFEIQSINLFPEILKKNPSLKGLNVTIPYKKEIIAYLDSLDSSAEKVGAVNVIKIEKDKLTGYNSDYLAFKETLEKIISTRKEKIQALILGTGGSSLAVQIALHELQITFQLVSREKKPNTITYEELKKDPAIISSHLLIINTTPIGMYPLIDQYPSISYDSISSHHILYDLIYNPSETIFLQKGKEKGAEIKNGIEMLYLQAEKSWEIWNG